MTGEIICKSAIHSLTYEASASLPSVLEITARSKFSIICDRLRENRAQRGVRNIEKRSIDFLKMYCFKPAEGNG